MTAIASLACHVGSPGHAADTAAVLLVLDGSGSMWGQVDGKPKIEIARSVLGRMITNLPDTMDVGLVAYGHNRKGDCRDIEVVAPLGSGRDRLVTALTGVEPKGKTPLTESLRLAVGQFQEREGKASIVLVSDGKETCDGDPCAAARDAVTAGVGLRIHVVGFDVTPEERQQLVCVAEEGHGRYFSASNTEELIGALAQVEKEVADPPPPPPPPAAPTVLFEDGFDRDELGADWTIVGHDPDRIALADGSVLVVASEPATNLVLLDRELPSNFVATLRVNVELARPPSGTKGNSVGLYYWVDDENLVGTVTQARCCGVRRLPYVGKRLRGEWDLIFADQMKDRDVEGPSAAPETWYLQLERRGPKFTARASGDGTTWTEIGNHVFMAKGGRLGFGTAAADGNEIAAEFDHIELEAR